MGNFRFWLVLQISRYIIDQWELGIAQIEAKDQIKVLDFATWGLGQLGVFGVIWGQNPNIVKPRQYIYQNEAFRHVITMKWFPRTPDPKLGVFWAHLKSFGVKIKRFSHLGKVHIKMKHEKWMSTQSNLHTRCETLQRSWYHNKYFCPEYKVKHY